MNKKTQILTLFWGQLHNAFKKDDLATNPTEVVNLCFNIASPALLPTLELSLESSFLYQQNKLTLLCQKGQPFNLNFILGKREEVAGGSLGL